MKNRFYVWKKQFANWYFFIKIQWKIINMFPNIERFLIVLAPHRKGFFEVFLGLLVAWITDLYPRYVFIKYEIFRVPIISHFLKRIGGIPTDRKKKYTNRPKGSYIASTVELLTNPEKPKGFLVVTPEGTRITAENPWPKWKHGFYTIARKSGVPLVLVALDYENRKVIINPEPIYISPENKEDIESDLKKIRDWFSSVIPGYVPYIDSSDFPLN